MLLDLPEEMIEGHLLPFLKWNDLLRFRRVCKITKAITDGYLRVHPELAPELEINEEDKTFGAFLEMGIPSKKIYIKNVSGADIYGKDEEDIASFLERYKGIISSLRVDHLSLFVFQSKEYNFLDPLTLESLEVGHLGNGGKPLSPLYDDQEPIPEGIENLKVLKLGFQDGIDQGIGKEVDRFGLTFMKEYGGNLESLVLPYANHLEILEGIMPEELRDPLQLINIILLRVASYIGARAQCNQMQNLGSKGSNLKVIDFVNFHSPQIPSEVQNNAKFFFPKLCEMCVDHNVQMKNVHPAWFLGRVEYPEIIPPESGVSVLSLVNLHPCVSDIDMPNLERIEIPATSSSWIGPHWRFLRPLWPSLKTLDITVDSLRSKYFEFVEAREAEEQMAMAITVTTKVLFQFLFEDVVRPSVTELHLKFIKDSPDVAIPKAADIVAACPTLKKLTVVNWPGKNKALLELFGGLKGLEEISLENCRGLGNVAFVGLDTTSPIFLKLSKLRTLSLKGLDQMPKITDLLFTMVIRHLNLTHLTLTSEAPLNSVTIAGVRALLEGGFAGSIEKFPFQGWSLDGVSSEEFKDLEKQFRSYYML